MASNFFTSGAAAMTSDSCEWRTPSDLFAELDAEFDFTTDAASTHENALCGHHYTEAEDGLAQEWRGSVWCNPPYGRGIGKWVEKAATSNEGGVTVLLIPARTDTSWWHDWVVGHATEVRFVRGRLKFSDGEKAAPFPSAIVVYDKRQTRYWKVMA